MTAGSTPEQGGPSAGLQTTQLIYTMDCTMLTGEERGRGKRTGAERKGGIQSWEERGERKINEKTGVRKYISKVKEEVKTKKIIIRKERRTHSDRRTHNFSKREEA